MSGKKTIRYHTFQDDVVESADQQYELPEDYVWIREKLSDRIFAWLTYRLGLLFAVVYGKLFLHVRFVNRKVLRQYQDTGFFLFGNHTQMLGDVFTPAWLCRGKHIYTLASPANLGIPVLGKILPYLGALPIPGNIKKLGSLNKAVEQRVEEKNAIVVYPEAHLWPYYTKIRPYAATSFRYPVKLNVPSFCMTTTYQKRRFGKRPQITLYLDGPLFSENGETDREKAEDLHDKILACMQERSKNSTYEYYHYEEAGK